MYKFKKVIRDNGLFEKTEIVRGTRDYFKEQRVFERTGISLENRAYSKEQGLV